LEITKRIPEYSTRMTLVDPIIRKRLRNGGFVLKLDTM